MIPLDLSHPMESWIMVMGTVERPNEGISAFVSSIDLSTLRCTESSKVSDAALTLRRRILDAVRNHIIPRILQGVYGNIEFLRDNFKTYPALMVSSVLTVE